MCMNPLIVTFSEYDDSQVGREIHLYAVKIKLYFKISFIAIRHPFCVVPHLDRNGMDPS